MSEIPQDIGNIPADILNAAAEAVEAMPHRAPFKADVLHAIAKAIHAERERDRWQPMDTAPMDGTKFIGWFDDCVRLISYGKASHIPVYGFVLVDNGAEERDICLPLAWMPLPAAPKPEG